MKCRLLNYLFCYIISKVINLKEFMKQADREVAILTLIALSLSLLAEVSLAL